MTAPSPERPLPPDLDQALTALAGHGTLLVALDFDGVLAPLSPDREAVHPLPASMAALHRLAALPEVTVALVSGRSLATLARLADPPPGTVLIGSHGAQRGDTGTAGADGVALTVWEARTLALASAELARIVAEHPGTELEGKPVSVALHTRNAAREQAVAATGAALAGPGRLSGVTPRVGKEVVELLVVEADKGSALADLRAQLGSCPTLYAGDDVTDEDAFAVLGDQDVPVKVGPGPTGATYRVADPAAVAVLLTRLADRLAVPPSG